jgi:hypothetical protein
LEERLKVKGWEEEKEDVSDNVCNSGNAKILEF